ncbi:hypothetical protein BJV74DRAFT_389676 [Russula compacta]|nr:hypothetical protein BJV74DRAFT_389676 [Russula compacta]
MTVSCLSTSLIASAISAFARSCSLPLSEDSLSPLLLPSLNRLGRWRSLPPEVRRRPICSETDAMIVSNYSSTGTCSGGFHLPLAPSNRT